MSGLSGMNQFHSGDFHGSISGMQNVVDGNVFGNISGIGNTIHKDVYGNISGMNNTVHGRLHGHDSGMGNVIRGGIVESSSTPTPSMMTYYSSTSSPSIALEHMMRRTMTTPTTATTAHSSIPMAVAHPVSTDVFLTHTWMKDAHGRENHARVARVNTLLQRAGLTTWFDTDRMSGSVREAMVEGISSTSCVVVFITAAYRDKIHSKDKRDSCNYEFSYAFEQFGNTRMIPVVMEEGMRSLKEWKGVLGAALGGELYIDMVSDDTAAFSHACDDLARRIKSIISRA